MMSDDESRVLCDLCRLWHAVVCNGYEKTTVERRLIEVRSGEWLNMTYICMPMSSASGQQFFGPLPRSTASSVVDSVHCGTRSPAKSDGRRGRGGSGPGLNTRSGSLIDMINQPYSIQYRTDCR